MTKFETVKPSNRHGKKWTNGQYGQNGQGNFEARIEKRQASLPMMDREWIGNGSEMERKWGANGSEMERDSRGQKPRAQETKQRDR